MHGNNSGNYAFNRLRGRNVKMFEEFKETLRRVLLAKYSIGFIDGYEAGYEQRKREG